MGPTPNETARPTSSTSNSLPTGVDQGILHRRSTKLAQHAPRLLDLRGVAISEILDARKVPPTFTQFSNLPDVVRTLIWEFALNNNRRGTSPRLIQFTLNTRPKFDPSMTVRYHYNLHTLSGSGASTPVDELFFIGAIPLPIPDVPGPAQCAAQTFHRGGGGSTLVKLWRAATRLEGP